MESEFPSNAKSKKQVVAPKEEKDVKPVIAGKARQRKKPLSKKFSDLFLGGDPKGTAHHVVFEVMVPSAKEMFADMVIQGMERTLFGEVRSTSRRGRGPAGRTAYHKITKDIVAARDEKREVSNRSRARHDFDEIILDTRAEAMDVVTELYELVSKYEVASVADLYTLCNVDWNHTDLRWGWTDLRGTDILRVSDGFLIDLPKPEQID